MTYKDIVSDHYFQKVYDVTSMIPYGRVSTYGAIADFLALGSARMVGWALNHCHSADDIIPAHRVVNRLGELSGRLHFDTPTLMEERLNSEGVEVVNHKIINMDKYFWHPREMEEY
ncbi:MAG: MGMT family protein [Saprospiraceae bacterium]|jgi:methylated-DNA-protein-cysteine methyltransferase-like protein|nr:MGMT family protein [Saprospiraceae bacterium]